MLLAAAVLTVVVTAPEAPARRATDLLAITTKLTECGADVPYSWLVLTAASWSDVEIAESADVERRRSCVVEPAVEELASLSLPR